MNDIRVPSFNPLVESIAPPPIPTAQAWLASYDGDLGPAIDLSQAVPGDPPHPDLLKWLAEAGGSVECARYGPIAGDPEFRRVYAAHLAGVYGAPVSADEIQITAGCNQAFIVAAMAVAGPGSTVLLTSPCYFNHQDSLAMLGIGAGAVACRAENGFVPEIADLERSLTDTVRAVALVSPNNPTGAVYPADFLRRVFALCAERGIWLVLDETYRDFLAPDHGPPHDLFALPEWRRTLIQLYSFSKSFCVPGHRIGAIAAGAEAVGRIAKIMDNLQICAPRTAQSALTKALPALTAWRAGNAAEIAARAAAFQAALGQVAGWHIGAIGAYFAYVRHPFPGQPAGAVAERLARDFGVLALPGTYFGRGQDDWLRFAFANVGRETIAGLPERLSAMQPDRAR